MIPALAAGAVARRGNGKTWYVSPSGSSGNSGRTPAAPKLTIQSAHDLAAAGDTICVMPGSYSTNAVYGVDITTSGSVGKRLVIQGMRGMSRPVYTAGVNTWSLFAIDGASWITIDGIECVGNAPNITLTYAQANQANTNLAATGGSGIVTQDANSRHITVRNCLVHDFPGAGIGLLADYCRIENNESYNNAYYSPYAESGITWHYQTRSDGDTSYANFITGNKSYGNTNLIPDYQTGTITDGEGIILDGQGTSVAYDGKTLVANNVCYGNSGPGIEAFTVRNVDIVYNTTYQNCTDSSLDEGEISANGETNVRVMNNVMVASSTKAVKLTPSGSTYDYNLYYGGNSTPSPGAHDVTSDPLFTSAGTGDFSLQSGSPAIDTATSTITVVQDILGNPRPSGSGYDKGAFEH